MDVGWSGSLNTPSPSAPRRDLDAIKERVGLAGVLKHLRMGPSGRHSAPGWEHQSVFSCHSTERDLTGSGIGSCNTLGGGLVNTFVMDWDSGPLGKRG